MSGFINLLHNKQPASMTGIGNDGRQKQIALYYTPVLFDIISDTIQVKLFSLAGLRQGI
jgi:hypothetical protein